MAAFKSRSFRLRWILAGIMILVALFNLSQPNLADDLKILWYCLLPLMLASFWIFLYLDIKRSRAAVETEPTDPQRPDASQSD